MPTDKKVLTNLCIGGSPKPSRKKGVNSNEELFPAPIVFALDNTDDTEFLAIGVTICRTWLILSHPIPVVEVGADGIERECTRTRLLAQHCSLRRIATDRDRRRHNRETQFQLIEDKLAA